MTGRRLAALALSTVDKGQRCAFGAGTERAARALIECHRVEGARSEDSKLSSGELVLADAGYCDSLGIAVVVARGADVRAPESGLLALSG